MHHVCSFKHEKPALSTVVNVCCHGQKKVNTLAVKWGLEKEARRVYDYEEWMSKDHYCMKVQKSGFMINPDVLSMGASPDGRLIIGF